MIDPYTITRGNVTIRVVFPSDNNPDLSYLGTYTDSPTFPAWDRATRTVVHSADEVDSDARWIRSESRFIHEGLGDWSEDEYVEQDARRLEDYGNGWSCVAVRARAFVADQELGESTVWGIETDSGDDYFREVANNCADEAESEALANAMRVCEAIDKA